MPICDDNGGMLNDPVAIKLAEDHYWLSIADGDLLQFLLGIVIGKNLEVEISEPDVSPLAIQGPKAEELTAKVFGDVVRDIKFFRYKKLPFLDQKFVVARSGWSKQGGFEVYVEGTEYGMPLWEAFFEAGKDLNVRAGCPNLIERIESGLLSYGNDFDNQDNPFECGFEKYVNLDSDVVFLGKEKLKKIKSDGIKRKLMGVQIETNEISLTGSVNITDNDLNGRINNKRINNEYKQIATNVNRMLERISSVTPIPPCN